jgi:hypothetical protein
MRHRAADHLQPAFDLAPPPLAENTTRAARLHTAPPGLVPHLATGRVIDAHTLRTAMTQAFGASDGEGAWTWKLAYDVKVWI